LTAAAQDGRIVGRDCDVEKITSFFHQFVRNADFEPLQVFGLGLFQVKRLRLSELVHFPVAAINADLDPERHGQRSILDFAETDGLERDGDVESPVAKIEFEPERLAETEAMKEWPPLTTNQCEYGFSRVVNRIKHAGRRWSDQGLLNWLTMAVRKIFEPANWNSLWRSYSRFHKGLGLRALHVTYRWIPCIT
jgi:hypothetical protein